MRQLSRRFAAPLVLALLCVLFHWKLVLAGQYTWLNGPDTAHQVLPWLQYQAGEWHKGNWFPTWDPYLWGGQSLIGQAQPGAAYPLNWLLFLLPLRDGWMRQAFLHEYYVAIHILAALFMYALCRELNRSRGASVVAGLIFGLGGWMGATDWPQMLNGAVWAPAVFLFFFRVARGHRPWSSTALCGVSLGMAFLSGHHQVPIFLSLALAGAWIWLLVNDRSKWRYAAAFAVFFLAAGALQTLPAAEYGKHAVRWVGASEPAGWKDKVPYHVHSTYSLDPYSLIGIVVPGVKRNADPHAGWTAVLLALLALVSSWRDPFVRVLCAVAFGGLVLALGEATPVHGILYALVPQVDKARNPSMAIVIFHFGLAALSAYGIDEYRQKYRTQITGGLLAAGSLLALLMTSLAFARVGFDSRLGTSAFVAIVLAGVFRAWSGGALGRKAAVFLFAALALTEIHTVAGWNMANRDKGPWEIDKLKQHGDIAKFLRTQPDLRRVAVDDQLIPYNFGDWYGIEHFGGYLASMSTNLHMAQGSALARRMWGVNYWVGSAPNGEGQTEVFTSASGLKVFHLPDSFPRAWTVHRAIAAAGPDQFSARLNDPSFDPRAAVTLAAPLPSLETCEAPERAEVTSRSSHRTVVEVELGCAGLVVLNDTWDPGWKAAVDGQSVEVREAYGFLLGVAVPKGKHEIVFRYAPATVTAGAALTLLAIAGAFGLVALKR